MKKKYILALTFLCLLMGQNSYGQMNGGDLDEVCVGGGCDEEEDSNDPCDPWSSSYDFYICNGMDVDEDSGDPCDPTSISYDYDTCYGIEDDYCYYYPEVCYPDDPEPNDPPPPTNCTATSIAAGEAATNFFADNVLQQSNNFSPFTFNQGQNEEWFSIEDNNGVIDAGPIITLTPNGGTPQISSTAIADVHTHTEGGYSRPSAADLWGLGNARAHASNFSDSYVIAFDGTKYDLHISDPNLLAAFMTANGSFYDPNTNGFLTTSTLGMNFKNAYDSLTNNNPNMSIFEAQERAFAYIMKGSGVDLLKANPGSNEFKKIDIVPAKNPDGTEKKDANGHTIYENADCN